MIKAFFPAMLWLAAITLLSTRGGVSMPEFNLFQTDKLAHAVAYFLLTWLILRGIVSWQYPRRIRVLQALAVVLFAAAFGALMEWVQFRFFPDRRFEYDDMLANSIGAVFGWFFFARISIGKYPAQILNSKSEVRTERNNQSTNKL
ncbi:MAG: VanZ family protein [Lewinellaceae bacterium]|nr:VanZ family protein [Lewinellaceae bacterium]